MITRLQFPPGVFESLKSHLLPEHGRYEEAAFLQCTVERTADRLTLSVAETRKMRADEFAVRHSDFLELKDGVQAGLIKRAHDLGTCLVEMHSHVGSYRAEFSYSDLRGLADNVPHIWWRLKGRPYAALVLAEDGIDALIWADDPRRPLPLHEIADGDRVIRPVGTTWREWV